MMWALDPKVAMPTREKLDKLAVEDTGADFSTKESDKKRKKRLQVQKAFQFLLRTETFKEMEVK